MKDYVTCPGCKVDIALSDHTLLGELVKCLACGNETEVRSLGPFIPNLEGVEGRSRGSSHETHMRFMSSIG
jgi:lysine biosynthesis protein LysW